MVILKNRSVHWWAACHSLLLICHGEAIESGTTRPTDLHRPAVQDAEWSPPSIRAKASFTRAGTAPSCFLKSWQIPPLGRILRVFLLEAGRGPIFFHWLKSFRLWEKVCGQMDICHHHGQMCNDSLIHSYMVFYSHTDHKDILKATIKVAL